MTPRLGQKMDAASCRYCHGKGHIMVLRRFLRDSGPPASYPRKCHHIVGNPFNENRGEA